MIDWNPTISRSSPNGRRNRYTIKSHLPLPDPLAGEHEIGDLLAILTAQPPADTNGQPGADVGRR